MRLAAAATVILLATASTASAQPEIVRADADLESGVVTALGHGFGTTSGRAVLNGSRGSLFAELIAITWTDTEVVALLPSGLPDGAYHLEISTRPNGKSPNYFDRIDITIGAKGPKGDAGPQGLAGTNGVAGPTGATGAAGPQGAAGPSGATGPQGPAGPAGQAGAAGPTGSIGPVGPIGPQGEPGAAGPTGPSGVLATNTTVMTGTTLNATLQTLGSLSFDVAADATPVLFAEADGNLFLSAGSGTYGVVEIKMVLDGVTVQTIKTEVLNYLAGNLSNAWHLHTMRPVAGGTHDLHLEARVLSTTGSVQINSPNAGRLSLILLR